MELVFNGRTNRLNAFRSFVWVVTLGCLTSIANAAAIGFELPGTADDLHRIDLGFFAGGLTLDVEMSGTVMGVPAEIGVWNMRPDGSLNEPYTGHPGYAYLNEGATGYPTTSGGDGINHFVGGGANYDTGSSFTGLPPDGRAFGFAGVTTTDTTPTTI